MCLSGHGHLHKRHHLTMDKIMNILDLTLFNYAIKSSIVPSNNIWSNWCRFFQTLSNSSQPFLIHFATFASSASLAYNSPRLR